MQQASKLLSDPDERPNSRKIGLVWSKESRQGLNDWCPPSPGLKPANRYAHPAALDLNSKQ
jgi:hypothetical protein